MNKQHHSKRMIAIRLIMLFTLSFALTGCSPASETAITGSASPSVTAHAATSEHPTTAKTEVETDGISYVSIDVNPSIELTVKYGVVLDATAYNDDGAEILLSNNVLGLTPDEAAAALIDGFATDGYLSSENTDAAIVITVYGDENETLLTNLQMSAADKLTTLGIACNIVASEVEPEVAQIARAAGITPGRYLLIKYLADRDGITIEQARDLYGKMKMKDLLKMIPDAGEVFGDEVYAYVSSVIEGLTPEQLQVLTQAKVAYQAAMKAAVKAYNQAKEEARAYFQSARNAAQAAFKSTHDQQAWKQAKTLAKQEMEQRYQTAKQAFIAAKAQAQEAFTTAVSGLGLTQEQIEAILAWNFDDDWSFDYNWQDGQNADTDEQGRQDQDVQGNQGNQDVQNDQDVQNAQDARGNNGKQGDSDGHGGGKQTGHDADNAHGNSNSHN